MLSKPSYTKFVYIASCNVVFAFSYLNTIVQMEIDKVICDKSAFSADKKFTSFKSTLYHLTCHLSSDVAGRV